MRKKRLLAAAFCAAMFASTTGVALAGEVKGPPGTGARTQEQVDAIRTGAPAHSQSICSYNGLNDMIIGQGPIDNIVQTPHTQGSPGDAGHGTCAGGTNPENQP